MHTTVGRQQVQHNHNNKTTKNNNITTIITSTSTGTSNSMKNENSATGEPATYSQPRGDVRFLYLTPPFEPAPACLNQLP